MENQNDFIKLIEDAIAGDQDSFLEIFNLTVNDVTRTVNYLLMDKSSTEEVIQEIYLALFQSLAKFNVEKSFRPWLAGITNRQIKAFNRRRWFYLRKSAKILTHGTINYPDFSDEIINKSDNVKLLIAIKKLSYKLREVIILHYLNEYSQQEIANILSVPLGTVRSRISYALKKLREERW